MIATPDGTAVLSSMTRRSARLGRQPLEVAALPGGEVVAHDWQTGDLLRGALRRRWFGL